MLYYYYIIYTCFSSILLLLLLLLMIIDHSKRSNLLQHLKEQLKNKRMIYSKDQLELSSAIGQGIIIMDVWL